MPPRRKAKIYIRVSSTRNRPDDPYPPETQERACRLKAERENMEIVGVVQDLDKSGRTTKNRQINAMVEEVQRGEYEIILVRKWSRFGRNLRDSLNNMYEIEEAGGAVMSATEEGDGKTSMGMLSRDMMTAFAQFQSNQIGDSWKDTFEVRKNRGLPHNGVARFGYLRDGQDFNHDPILGPALAEVYERFVAGERLYVVAMDMRDRGVRASNGDVILNARWLRFMDSGYAAGLIRTLKEGATSRRFDQWEWYQGSHKPLISMETWEAYKRKRLGGLGKNWAQGKAKYSLSGLVTCGICMTRKCTATGGAVGKPDVVFRCSGINSKECRGVGGILRLGEAAVLKWLETKALDADSINEQARRAVEKRRGRDDLVQLEKLVDKHKAALGRLLDLYLDGKLTRDVYVEKEGDLSAKIREAEQAVRDHRGDDRPEVPATFYASTAAAWSVMTHDQKRQILQRVIKTIVLHPNGHPGGRWEIVPYDAH